MLRKLMKAVPAIIAAAGMAVCVMAAPVRYEAQAARLDNSGVSGSDPADWVAVVASSPVASGQQYVKMNAGNIFFENISIATAGYYVIWINYSNSYGGGKEQNFLINNVSQGATTFDSTAASGGLRFVRLKLAAKVYLNAGTNSVGITKNWGWIDVDYLEVEPFEATPFNISRTLATQSPSLNARKVFSFLYDNFGKKVISGVMSSPGPNVNSSQTIEALTEVAYIRNNSGNKTPALIGFDFLQGIGKEADEAKAAHGLSNSWFHLNAMGTVRLAEDLFKKGGIPTFSWHWRDPMRVTNEFYVYNASHTPHGTQFKPSAAFPNGVAATNSAAYQAILRDIDTLAVNYLKPLADKDIPILWRPLHEASGRWFWWGVDGPAPCKALWIMMFNRLTTHHNLKNLIWVWTTDEAADALEWYPGDEYVDIVGLDFYYYPPERNHGSLMSSFEKLKDIFSGRKIIALSENGSFPYPANMEADGAWWSYVMPWNDDDGFVSGALHNGPQAWNTVMNHNIILTLENMLTLVGPSWANYQATSVFKDGNKTASGAAVRAPAALVRGKTLKITSPDNSDLRIKMVNAQGRTVRTFKSKGSAELPLKNIPAGRYFVEIKKSGKMVGTSAVTVK